MEWRFSAPIIEWRGPAPFYFVATPEEVTDDIDQLAPQLTYGWGVIPVQVRLGATSWSTSLFPREGTYLIPLKVAVRRAEGVDLGDHVTLTLSVQA